MGSVGEPRPEGGDILSNLTLRQWRLVKERTINDMADACGVHPNTYALWEKNPESVKVKDALKVAEVLGVPVDEIFFNQAATKCSTLEEVTT